MFEDHEQYENPIGPAFPLEPANTAIDYLTGKISSNLSEALYYDSDEKKITDSSIRKQLDKKLFDTFPFDTKVGQNLRHDVSKEIMKAFVSIRKTIESMPKDVDEYNEMVMILLFQAVISAAADNLTNISSYANLKTTMIKHFLKDS